jgi:tetratricopeptide (TPR) repeat protein
VVFLFLAHAESLATEKGKVDTGIKASRNAAYLVAQAGCKTNFSPENVIAYARACFELADVEEAKEKKLALSQAGIAACERSLIDHPSSADLHYYLAENLGQAAATKKMGALPLLRQMEEHWLKALFLNPDTDYAGPDRSLGLLYDQAPGWPVSLGSRTKARQHLEHAVEIAPDFPENRLCLVEALIKWHELAKAREALLALQKVWGDAQKKYSEPKWSADWPDWGRRRDKLAQELLR